MFSDKFIHIHVPKTAGQKVRSVLFSFEKKFQFLNKETHLSMQEVKRILAQDYKNTENIFSFTFTRNPWDFYVSRFFIERG